MTSCSVLQARELADQLLQPPEETFAGMSGSRVVTHDHLRGKDRQAEQNAASCFEKLACVVSKLAPITPLSTAQSAIPTGSPAPLVEEVSDQQAELEEQQVLVARSCQAAALYAADAALLTPWSTLQLDVAARTLIKHLCAAMPQPVTMSPQAAPTQNIEQDLIVAIMPAILPLLSLALIYDGTHSLNQGEAQQEGKLSSNMTRSNMTHPMSLYAYMHRPIIT